MNDILRVARNSKLIELFFSEIFNLYFGLQLTTGNGNQKTKPWVGRLLNGFKQRLFYYISNCVGLELGQCSGGDSSVPHVTSICGLWLTCALMGDGWKAVFR